MTVRAKFRCHFIQKGEGHQVVNLSPVTEHGADENAGWSKWTPSGQISMHITNPAAFEQFEQEKEYYVDFTPAE